MDRRDFLHYSGTASILTTGLISPSNLFAQDKMPKFNNFDELVLNLLKLNDGRVKRFLELQERDQNSKYYGGVTDAFGIYTPGATSGLVKVFACSVSQKQSEYYLDKTLIASINVLSK